MQYMGKGAHQVQELTLYFEKVSTSLVLSAKVELNKFVDGIDYVALIYFNVYVVQHKSLTTLVGDT